jgi:phosphatidylglycerol:prolipoprotein diacylglycerol transferase
MSPNLHPPRRGFLGFLLDFHNRTILFQVGQFILVTYGVVAGLAFFAAVWGAFWYSAALGYSLNDLMIFYSCFMLPSVLVGARAFSILLEWRQLFVDPIRTLIKPGYMLHGGVFGGTVALFVYGAFGPYSTLSLMDAWGLMMPLGEAIIRLGCYVYGCCWGKPTESHYGIAYTSPHSKVIRCAPHLHGVKIHPSQVYATLAHGIQFALFCMLLSHKAFDGMFAGLYMLTHPIIRVLLERFRQDDRGKLIGPFTHTNLYSLVQMLIGVGMLLIGAQIGANTPLDLALPVWSVLSHTPTLVGCAVIGVIAMLAFGLHFGKVGSWVTSAQGHAPTTACDHAHSAEDPQFGGE